MAGAPLGNNNAGKGRRWAEALRKALARYSSDVVEAGQALDAIAKSVVERAVAGDKDAITEIANRLDGKPAQALTVSGDEDNPLRTHQVVSFIHAGAEDVKKANGHSVAGEVRETLGTGEV